MNGLHGAGYPRPMRRPSPALAISIIALVGAWGGPAMAKALIDSGDIKDRSIKGRDVAGSTITSRNVTGLRGSDIVPDSLDGSDIDERTLNIPKVDAAEKADAVAGVHIERFAYADPEGKSEVFYDSGGLRVAGFCNNGQLEVSVTATADDGIIRNQVTAPDEATRTEADDDFDTGESLQLLPPALDDISGALTYYQPGGDALTIQYLAASNLPASTAHQCLLAGVAIRADG